jgi:hypothetical protein
MSKTTLLGYLMAPGLPTRKWTKHVTRQMANIVGNRSRRDFTYDNILQHYGHVLQQVQIKSESMLDSPPLAIETAGEFANRFTSYIESRLRRALRAGFQHLVPKLTGSTSYSSYRRSG